MKNDKNKIVCRYIKPRLILVVCYFLLSMCALYGLNNISDKRTEKESTEINNFLSVALVSYIVFICTLFLSYNIYSAHKFLSDMTYYHIKDLIHEYTELKKFENILSNPRALRYIATVISNNLNLDEQKKIKNIMVQTTNGVKPTKFEDAYKETQRIIGNHIQTDPDFGRHVYNAVLKAYNEYVVSVNRNYHTR